MRAAYMPEQARRVAQVPGVPTGSPGAELQPDLRRRWLRGRDREAVLPMSGPLLRSTRYSQARDSLRWTALQQKLHVSLQLLLGAKKDLEQDVGT